MTTTNPEMHRALRQGRRDRGWSLDEATFQARTRFPNLRVGRGKISRYEGSKPISRDRLDVPVVAALCVMYGLSFEEVAPDLVGALVDMGEAARQVADDDPGHQ